MGDDGFMQRASANQQEAACRNRLQGHAILFIGLTQNGQTLFLNRRAGNVDHAPISVNGHMQILRETGAGRQMDVQESRFGDWPLHPPRHGCGPIRRGSRRQQRLSDHAAQLDAGTGRGGSLDEACRILLRTCPIMTFWVSWAETGIRLSGD